MSPSRRIAVAMSGGVDSSVAAALLKDQGESLFGIMLRLWSAGSENPNRCCSPEDLANARRVAHKIEIPFYTYGVQDLFREVVVDSFIDGYAQGITPNPCIHCNRQIRWGALLQYALSLGATHLATGHYARVLHQDKGFRLARAIDPTKDQSYILSMLGPDELSKTIFPLGDYRKTEVRRIAQELELPVADRVESQDLCFTGNSDYYSFLLEHGDLRQDSGPILNQEGAQLGTHQGLAKYTIGQRKGIGISFPVPLYVLDKDVSKNALIVGPRTTLGTSAFQVAGVNWVDGKGPNLPETVSIQVRYKAPEVQAVIEQGDQPARLRANLAQPVFAVTPGQLAAFYQDSVCLGGGIIQR